MAVRQDAGILPGQQRTRPRHATTSSQAVRLPIPSGSRSSTVTPAGRQAADIARRGGKGTKRCLTVIASLAIAHTSRPASTPFTD
jgi:hypothetical protein